MSTSRARENDAAGEPSPPPGATIFVSVGARSTRVRVVSWNGLLGVIESESGRLPADGEVSVRYLDDEGGAWEARATTGAADVFGTRAALRLLAPFRGAAVRRARRYPAVGLLLRCETDELDIDLDPIDISASGCFARGDGAGPPIGAAVRLTPGIDDVWRRPLSARVVRCEQGADGFNVAFAFDLETGHDRAGAAWLVAAARRSA